MSSKKDPLLCPPTAPTSNSTIPPPTIIPGTPTPGTTRTYVAGEDAGRLARAASFLGLDEHDEQLRRQPRLRRPVREAVAMLWNDSTLASAARMHSVGALGQDEVVDNSGTLHLHYTLRRRRTTGAATVPAAAGITTSPQKKQSSYGTLTDLFHREELAQPPQPPTEEGEGEEEEEEVVVDMVEGGSLNAAIFGIVKGTVGPAILYLPRGFQVSGYAVAIPAMLFATFMYIFNAHRLLDCWKVESDKNHKIAARMQEVRALLESTAPVSFPSLKDNRRKTTATATTMTEVASPTSPTTATTTTTTNPQQQQQQQPFTPKLLTYPELARLALGPYAFVVELGIASMQFGVCLTYLIFVPQNLHECTLAMTGRSIPKIYFTIAMVLVEIPMSWIRDIRKLTPTNVLATILIAYGLCCVLVIAVMYGFSPAADGHGFAFQQNLAALPAITDAWFIFIGTSFFMMEGSITLLVPLQEAVFLPQDKAKFPGVNQIVTSWIVLFYIAFSMICAAAFGAGIHTALTASLHGALAVTVQLAYSIAVIFTFPLQAFPALEVAMKALLPGGSSGSSSSSSSSENKDAKHIFERNALATLLTCLLGVIAIIAIDYLGNVVSILGSLFGIPLALVYPPLMHNILVLNQQQNADPASTSSYDNKTQRYANYCVVVIGVLAMGAASFATIVTWDKGAEGG